MIFQWTEIILMEFYVLWILYWKVWSGGKS